MKLYDLAMSVALLMNPEAAIKETSAAQTERLHEMTAIEIQVTTKELLDQAASEMLKNYDYQNPIVKKRAASE